MTVSLWVVQVALAPFCMMVGYSHALAPFDQVAQEVTWMQHVPLAGLALFVAWGRWRKAPITRR
jgi:hypothetical protein